MPSTRHGIWLRFVRSLAGTSRFDVFLHPRVRESADPLLILRAKLLAITGVIALFLSPFVAGPYFQVGEVMLGVYTLGFALLIGGNALVIRSRGSVWLATAMVCLGFWGAIVTGYAVLGGLASAMGYWMMIIPMVGLFFGGIRQGVAWFVVCLTSFIALVVLESLGVIGVVIVFEPDMYKQFSTNNIVVYGILGWMIAITTEAVRAVLVERARRDERRLETVLEAAADSIIALDADGSVVLANQRAREVFSSVEVAASLATSTSEWVESEGRAFTVSVADVEEDDVQKIAILRDETIRRDAAVALREARDQAEAANLAKSRFLMNMSHELRTPLNAIIGYTDLVLEEMEDDGVSTYNADLHAVRDASRHLVEIVSDILEISKIESGQAPLNRSTELVGAFLDSLLPTARVLVEQTGGTFEVIVSADTRALTLETDTGKLRRVLLNLFSNAAKFTDRGRVVFEVEHDRERDVLSWMVRDDGVGIAPDVQQRIWGLFSQGDDSPSREHQGLGLGLSLVLGLSRALGGSVTLESELGEGAAFTVEIPRVSSVDDAS